MAAVDRGQPPAVRAIGADAARAGADRGATRRGVDGIEDHQPGIVDHAIGIGEGLAEWTLQRNADRMVVEIDRCRCRQVVPGCQAS
jgi:hypothetical protein